MMVHQSAVFKPTYNILVLYSQYSYPMRTTSWDNLYCFREYSHHRVFYLNLFLRPAPGYLRRMKFDLVIFHDLFVCQRWGGVEVFHRLLERARVVKDIDACKVVMPQDEFIYSDLLCLLIGDFGVQRVYSVSPESELPKIYSGVDPEKTKFSTILTGYLDDKTLKRISRLAREKHGSRRIDIGYRAKYHNAWIGRHGMLKSDIADVFKDEAPKKGLNVDISMRDQDAFIGDAWYDFLLDCRFTIGVEGGASILDRDGSVFKCTEHYVALHPEADFDEIEKTCFPGRDGELALLAISPRHLEACATRTGQVLIEGAYNGILEPGVHYIELKADFSNLDQVLEMMKDESLLDSMIERAYEDIVASNRYSYRHFVQESIDLALEGIAPRAEGSADRLISSLACTWFRFTDWAMWRLLAVMNMGVKYAPRSLIQAARRLIRDEE